MSKFESVDFLEPDEVYLRLAHWRDSGEWTYIGPFDGLPRLDCQSLIMGDEWVGCQQDGTWLIEVEGDRIMAWDIVEVVIGPTNRGYEIGEWEGYCDAAAAHDHASGR